MYREILYLKLVKRPLLMNDDLHHLIQKALNTIKPNVDDQCILFKQIENTSNTVDILKYLLNFLINDFLNKSKRCQINKDKLILEKLINEIHNINAQCPLNMQDFKEWLPQFIVEQNETVNTVKKRLAKLKLTIKDMLKYINSLTVEQRNQANIVSIEKYNLLKEKLSNEKMKAVQYENMCNLYREKIDKQKSMIKESLNTESPCNNNYEAEIAFLKSKIKVLKNNNSELNHSLDLVKQDNERIIKCAAKYKNELEELKEMSILRNNDTNSKQKFMIEKEQIHSDYQIKINQLQNQISENNCIITQLREENLHLRNELKRIQSNPNTLSSSKDLYETIGRLTTENEILKNDYQNFINKNSKKPEKYFEDISILTETVQILTKENSELRKQNESLQNLLSEARALNNSAKLNPILTPQCEIEDENKNDSYYQTIIEQQKSTIKQLEKRLLSTETEKIKLNESLRKSTIPNKCEDIELNLKKFGFLLADALCQHFNPSRVKFEVKRLIEVARSEHIQLSESARVLLNPFEISNSGSQSNIQNLQPVLFSKFDELECQLTALQTSWK